MEQNRIWLILFALVAAIGGYLWWSGSGQAPAVPSAAVDAESPVENSGTEAPVFGGGFDNVEPPAPTIPSNPPARLGDRDAASPHVDSAPPPGFQSPPPNFETFSPPTPNPDPGQGFGGAESGVPPQNFENPDFVTPPPAPPQFDNEAVPFDEEVPMAPPMYDSQPGQDDFAPPPQPGEDF
jgi:hypothetical protein